MCTVKIPKISWVFLDYEQLLFMFSFFFTVCNHDGAQKADFCFQHWSHSLKNPGVTSSVNLSVVVVFLHVIVDFFASFVIIMTSEWISLKMMLRCHKIHIGTKAQGKECEIHL